MSSHLQHPLLFFGMHMNGVQGSFTTRLVLFRFSFVCSSVFIWIYFFKILFFKPTYLLFEPTFGGGITDGFILFCCIVVNYFPCISFSVFLWSSYIKQKQRNQQMCMWVYICNRVKIFSYHRKRRVTVDLWSISASNLLQC